MIGTLLIHCLDDGKRFFIREAVVLALRGHVYLSFSTGKAWILAWPSGPCFPSVNGETAQRQVHVFQHPKAGYQGCPISSNLPSALSCLEALVKQSDTFVFPGWDKPRWAKNLCFFQAYVYSLYFPF